MFAVPYANVIKRLNDGDQDIKINALTLLNVIHDVCDDEEKVAALLKDWEAAGIVDALKVIHCN